MTCKKFFLALPGVWFLTVLAVAQVPHYEPELIESPDPGRPSYVYRGSQVPKYHVVSVFFKRLHFKYNQLDNGRSYEHVLQQLGVERGTAMEAALLSATSDAMRSEGETLDVRPYLGDSAQFAKVQREFSRRKVRALKLIYRELLNRFKSDEVARHKFQAYLETQVRPEVSVFTLGGPGTDEREIEAEFEGAE
jgi:hypothetical protein